jgi:hypothetical protein
MYVIEERESTPEPLVKQCECASSPFMVTPPVPAAKRMSVVKLTPRRVPSNTTDNNSDWSATSNETVDTDSVMAAEDMTFIIPHMIVYGDSEGNNYEEKVHQHDNQSSVMLGPNSSFMFYSDSSINEGEGFSYMDPVSTRILGSTPVRVYPRRETPETPKHKLTPSITSDSLIMNSPLPLRRKPKTANLHSDPFTSDSPLARKIPNNTRSKRRHTLTRKFLNALSLSRTKRRTTLDIENSLLFADHPRPGPIMLDMDSILSDSSPKSKPKENLPV